jgi:hypothetical protein
MQENNVTILLHDSAFEVTSNSFYKKEDYNKDKEEYNKFSGYVGTTKEVTNTSGNNTDTDYYTCTTYIRIWIDGCDHEAVRAFANGQFRFDLRFNAIEVPQTTSSGVTEESTSEAP